ncbi:MAG: NYN domain-containing protein [Nitrospirae bacterium]|nr:NYN domain-containing protein [Nitrospirota bacterium]
MSYIIIDGYNLIGTAHRDLKKQRETLINSLIEYKKRKGHEITLVFDGWRSGSAKESHIITGGIKIIYSRIGDTADSVIKRIISKERREWIVVTSDRAIADYAWQNASIPISSDDFYKALFITEQDYTDDEELEYTEIKRKGNPRQLSKKEKAIKRALNKL